MLGLVLAALITAGIADFGTELTNVVRQSRPPTHPRRCCPADFGAVSVEADALGHRGNIRFFETRIRAMFAFLGTSDARLDAGLVFLVSHDIPF